MPRVRPAAPRLPIEVKLATDLPAKLTLNPQLPELRGTVEIDLRVPARHQERQRQEGGRQPVGAGAAEFRGDLHRAVRQPGAQRAAARSGPVQGREAQGASAQHGRSQQVQGGGQGFRRRRHRDRRSRPRHHRSAQDRHHRARRPAERACLGRNRELDPDRAHQFRHRAGRASSFPVRRRPAGRSTSSPRRSIASLPTRTRRCRR